MIITGVIFPNQKGPVCVVSIDDKVYLADKQFLEQVVAGELELEHTIELTEEEVIFFEDSEGGEASVGEVQSETSG